MDAEFDYDLTQDQWETLKMLRPPAPERRPLNRQCIEALAALGLVTVGDDLALITANGRRALVRGSTRLLDVAA